MSESNRQREQDIERRASELFAAEVRGLDGRTRSRLAAARARAVEAASAERPAFGHETNWLLPLGGVAAAVLAVVMIWQNPGVGVDSPDPVEAAVVDDLDLLLEGEELEFLEELDFYAWLLERPELLVDGGAAGDSG